MKEADSRWVAIVAAFHSAELQAAERWYETDKAEDERRQVAFEYWKLTAKEKTRLERLLEALTREDRYAEFELLTSSPAPAAHLLAALADLGQRVRQEDARKSERSELKCVANRLRRRICFK